MEIWVWHLGGVCVGDAVGEICKASRWIGICEITAGQILSQRGELLVLSKLSRQVSWSYENLVSRSCSELAVGLGIADQSNPFLLRRSHTLLSLCSR